MNKHDHISPRPYKGQTDAPKDTWEPLSKAVERVVARVKEQINK